MDQKEILKDRIIQVLKTIHDPEIPVDIYSLGLIYLIDIDDNNDVLIEMTLTAPNCPVAENLPLDVEQAVKQVLKDGYRTIDIMPQEEEKRNGVEQVGTARMGDLICERI